MDNANKPNATCAICGKPYRMCYSCKKNDGSLVWKRFCDTPEHYKIYQLVHGYTTGLYTKSEAKRKLKNIDTSDIDELRSHIRDILMDIMGSDKSGEPVAEDKENTETVETYVSSEQLPEVATQSSTKPRRTRKRSVAKTSDDMNDASDDMKSEPVEA